MALNQPVSFLDEAFKNTDFIENNQEQEVASTTADSESKRTIDNDEDDNLAVSSNSIMDRANDLIYNTFLQITMGYKPSTALEYLNIFLEDLQPISYAFDYKLFIPIMPKAFQTMMNLLQYRGDSYSFRKFMVVFSLCIAAIVIFYSYFSYVMISCWRGRFKFGHSIKMIRLLAIFIPASFFLPFIDTLISGVDCTFEDESINLSSGFSTAMTKKVACTTAQHVPILALGIIFSFLLLVISVLFQLLHYEHNPYINGPTSKVHGRIGAVYCVLKIALAVLWKSSVTHGELEKGTIWPVLTTAAAFILCSVMAILMIKNYPYFNGKINHTRFAFYAVGALLNLGSLLYAVIGLFKEKNPYDITLSLYLLIAPVPAFILSYTFSYVNFKRTVAKLNAKIVEEAKKSGSESNNRGVLLFTDWVQIDFVGRAIGSSTNYRMRFIDFSTLWDPFNFTFERGTKEWPNIHILLLLHALYLNHLNDYEFKECLKTSRLVRDQLPKLILKVTKKVKKIKRQNPFWDVKFTLVYMDRLLSEHKLRSSNDDDSKMDVAAYAEFKKKERTAFTNHKQAVATLHQAWSMISSKDFSTEQLRSVCERLYDHYQIASRTYADLARKFPNNLKILRGYANFLLQVAHQPYRAKNMIITIAAIEDQNRKDEDKFMARMEKDAGKKEAEQNAKALGRSKSFHSEGSAEGKSNHSGSSSGATSVELQAENLKKGIRARITEKLSKKLGTLSLNNILISVVAFGAVLLNFFLINGLIQRISIDILYFYEVNEREYYVADEFASARKMYKALDDKNEKSFNFYNDRVKKSIEKLNEINEFLFEKRDKSDIEYSNEYTTRQYDISMAAYPERDDRFNIKGSLYDFLGDLSVTGTIFSEYEYDQYFAITNRPQRWLDENNNFRYIMDNFEIATSIFETSNILFRKQAERNTAGSADTMAIALTVLQLGIVFLNLLVVDYLVRTFFSIQNNSLNLLRFIPSSQVKEIIQEMEAQGLNDGNESDDDEAGVQDIDLTNSNRRSFLQGKNGYRARYGIYFIILMILSISTVIYNKTSIRYLGKKLAVLNTYGETKSYGAICVALVKEMVENDIATWPNPSDLRNFYIRSVSHLSQVHQYILTGDVTFDPPGYGKDELPADVKKIVLEPNCLPTNQSLCGDPRRYNNSIDFTADHLERGLDPLLSFIMTKLTTLNVTTAKDANPNPLVVEFLEKVMMYDFPDGFEKVMIAIVQSSIDEALQVNTMQVSLLIGTLGFVFLSFFIVFLLMYYELKEKSDEVSNLMLHIPQNVGKSVPEIGYYLQTGDIPPETVAKIEVMLAERSKGVRRTRMEAKTNDKDKTPGAIKEEEEPKDNKEATTPQSTNASRKGFFSSMFDKKGAPVKTQPSSIKEHAQIDVQVVDETPSAVKSNQEAAKKVPAFSLFKKEKKGEDSN